MPASQNGYSANDRSVIASYTIPGTNLRVALRQGDVSVVLLEYLRRYHLEVEPLPHNPQDLWGYAERAIRGSSTVLSNHASGSAVDARATRHPLGVKGTFTAEQVAALNRLLAWFEGVLRHGKDYSGRVDEMHVEINKGPAEVKRIADKIRAGAGEGEDMAQVPQQEWDDVKRKVNILCDALLGKRKPWYGGVSNIPVNSNAEMDHAEPYDAIQMVWRNNVNSNQALVTDAGVRQELANLNARVSALIEIHGAKDGA